MFLLDAAMPPNPAGIIFSSVRELFWLALPFVLTVVVTLLLIRRSRKSKEENKPAPPTDGAAPDTKDTKNLPTENK